MSFETGSLGMGTQCRVPSNDSPNKRGSRAGATLALQWSSIASMGVTMTFSARRSGITPALLGGIGAGDLAQPMAVDRAVTGAGRSRAEVRTQTLAAMARGLIPRGESSVPTGPFESARTRAA
jgi:hypothetical protein